MTDNKKALDVYNMIINVLNDKKWKYEADNDALKVEFTVVGEDLPMKVRVYVDGDKELVTLMSSMGFNFPAEKLIEGAIVTSTINYLLRDGSFDFDISDGEVLFRLTTGFMDSLISEDTLQFMIDLSLFTIDKYNDMFMELAKGYMSLEEFFAKLVD